MVNALDVVMSCNVTIFMCSLILHCFACFVLFTFKIFLSQFSLFLLVRALEMMIMTEYFILLCCVCHIF